jgi:hypothetical protein
MVEAGSQQFHNATWDLLVNNKMGQPQLLTFDRVGVVGSRTIPQCIVGEVIMCISERNRILGYSRWECKTRSAINDVLRVDQISSPSAVRTVNMAKPSVISCR